LDGKNSVFHLARGIIKRKSPFKTSLSLRERCVILLLSSADKIPEYTPVVQAQSRDNFLDSCTSSQAVRLGSATIWETTANLAQTG
jgi:hypothetical protein